ncbi:MAG TPA: dolichyl-phosphate-mannose--protein mannosyltransferase, partial [Allocoleopsis sp.]
MHQTFFRSLLVLLILLGITARFTNLGGKFYWVDEVFTSLRISGYTEQEVGTDLYQKTLFTVQDLAKYQAPGVGKSAIDTINGLATHEPQLPPVY